MNIESLLPYFEKVRPVGQNRWIALCPAHGDKNPSLSIKLVEDRILIHCFAGCTAEEITKAIGLGVGDLFLTSPRGRKKVDKKTEIKKAIEELRWKLLGELADILRKTDKRLKYITPSIFDQPPFAELMDKRDYWNWLFFELMSKNYDPRILPQVKEEIKKWKALMNN